MWVDFVKQYPILSAMIQFAVLGTVGELLGSAIRKGKFSLFSLKITLGKMLIWAILAVMIKYAFVGFTGFVHELQGRIGVFGDDHAAAAGKQRYLDRPMPGHA